MFEPALVSPTDDAKAWKRQKQRARRVDAEAKRAGRKPDRSVMSVAKGFSQSSKRRIHPLVHTGEKSYVMAVAGDSSIFSLQIHQRGHTGEKPYFS